MKYKVCALVSVILAGACLTDVVVNIATIIADCAVPMAALNAVLYGLFGLWLFLSAVSYAKEGAGQAPLKGMWVIDRCLSLPVGIMTIIANWDNRFLFGGRVLVIFGIVAIMYSLLPIYTAIVDKRKEPAHEA